MALGCRPRLQSELGHWLEDSGRFTAFISTNQDKVRKELSSADAEEGRLDVRSELLVAYLMLADRRFGLAFEAYGTHRAGPDLTASYHANQRFNLEVTRLRAAGEPLSADAKLASGAPDPGIDRLPSVIAGKLRQLPGDLPNALLITTRGLLLAEAPISRLRSQSRGAAPSAHASSPPRGSLQGTPPQRLTARTADDR